MDSELQQAIYTALTSSTALMAQVRWVYDDVPQPDQPGSASEFPYVTVGDDLVNQWPDDDVSNGNAIVRVHVYSRHAGRKEAKDILGTIRGVLDRSESLVMASHVVTTIDFQQSYVLLEQDHKTRHGVIEFRVLISA